MRALALSAGSRTAWDRVRPLGLALIGEAGRFFHPVSIVFRQFDPDRDYRLLADLHCRNNPDFLCTEEDLRRQDAHRPAQHPLDRYVGERDGVPICAYGIGSQYWADAEGRKHVEHFTDPETCALSLRAILDAVHNHPATDGISELNIWTRDDRPVHVSLFEERGYRLVERQPVTRLSLADFEARGLPCAIEGIRFASLAELEAEGLDWLRPIYEATVEMVSDIPSHQAVTPPSYETFAGWMEDRDTYRPEFMFVGIENGRIVAYSGVQASRANAGMVETGLSGVVRSHRRKGLVTALKVFAIERLRERGFKTIQTDNLDNNPMFGINQRLGFKIAWAWLHYLKEL